MLPSQAGLALTLPYPVLPLVSLSPSCMLTYPCLPPPFPCHSAATNQTKHTLTSPCREAVAAEDNLKFLLCLEEPCQGLVAAHPQQIPALLPPILNCIRMVWNISRFYNTPERVTVRAQPHAVPLLNCTGKVWNISRCHSSPPARYSVCAARSPPSAAQLV